MAAHAESTAGTYDAIRFALASLADHHSSLHLTPALEALEAEEKAKHPSPNPLPVRQEELSPYVGRYEPEGHLERRGDKSFAYVVLTKCFPENDQQFVAFETNLQRILAELDQSHPAGWIVDLRGNVGGNMWPMLGGIGPLIGEGDNHRLRFTDSVQHSTWEYRNGVSAEIDNGKATAYPAVASVPYHISGTPKVAVLDRPQHRQFWRSSRYRISRAIEYTFLRLSTHRDRDTANQTITLSDGASMWLTIGIDADRNGKQYIDGLAPDEAFPAATQSMQTSSDPVVQAALDWLSPSVDSPKTER